MSKRKKNNTTKKRHKNPCKSFRRCFDQLIGRTPPPLPGESTSPTLHENYTPTQLILPSTNALIYESELRYIVKCIEDYPSIETGGQLFGAWTASGNPRVIYAIGPGPRANHEGAFFNQDVEYLQKVGAKLKEYGLQHIGEWHSHHKLGLPYPSGHDANTMQTSIDQLNLNRMLLCIGSINECGIIVNPFNFAKDARYTKANWEIIRTHNRLREIVDDDLCALLHHPTSYQHVHNAQESNKYEDTGWFSDIENRKSFQRFLHSLSNVRGIRSINPQISDTKGISLKVTTNYHEDIIIFPHDFPSSGLIKIYRLTYYNQTQNTYTIDGWKSNDILDKVFRIIYKSYFA